MLFKIIIFFIVYKEYMINNDHNYMSKAFQDCVFAEILKTNYTLKPIFIKF